MKYRSVVPVVVLLALTNMHSLSAEDGLPPPSLSKQRNGQDTGASYEHDHSGMVWQSLMQSAVTLRALRAVREGNMALALETLEIDLDATVTDAWSYHGETADPKEREALLSALNTINSYRKKYPRKKEAEAGGGAPRIQRQFDDVRRRARKVLNQLPKAEQVQPDSSSVRQKRAAQE